MSMQNSNKTVWWILGILAVIIIAFFVFRGSSSTPSDTGSSTPTGIPNTGVDAGSTTTPLDPNAKG